MWIFFKSRLSSRTLVYWKKKWKVQSMNHNDRLKRLRYALDIKDKDMIKIFKLGGVDVTVEELLQMLRKIDEEEYELPVTDEQFERFLNGLIISQRGVKEGPEPALELTQYNANNLLLKKVKIALSLTTDNLLDIFGNVDIYMSKSELGSFLRKEGHRNYKPCLDNFARNFIKGLTIYYRG